MSASMAETAPLPPRGPLDGRRAEDRARRVAIEALPQGTTLQVVVAPRSSIPAERLRSVGALAGLAVRHAGPGAWLVADVALSSEAVRHVASALAPDATVVDQSHAQIRIRVAGEGAARLLATGTAVDLSPRAFPVGDGAETLFGHVGVHLARLGPHAFELLVPRSFAEHVWEELAPQAG
jgi:sarcosine oxidase subunit gamma